jgi:hypothetical protein
MPTLNRFSANPFFCKATNKHQSKRGLNAQYPKQFFSHGKRIEIKTGEVITHQEEHFIK